MDGGCAHIGGVKTLKHARQQGPLTPRQQPPRSFFEDRLGIDHQTIEIEDDAADLLYGLAWHSDCQGVLESLSG